MQQLKDSDSLTEIEEFAQKDYRIASCFEELFKNIHTQGISRMLNACKMKGFHPFSLFQVLFVLPFVEKRNIHQLVKSGINDRLVCAKDTLYRFLNNPGIPWRKIHHSFFLQILKLIDRQRKKMDSFTGDSTQRCFILDDTILPKAGKFIEKIGKVHDHNSNSYVLGIKALVSGLWDGKVFLPFDISLHNESGSKNKRGLRQKDLAGQYSKKRNALSPSYSRTKELEMSKIDTGIMMLKSFFRLKTDVRYVLMDSWFVCEKMLRVITKQANSSKSPLDLIGMLKINRVINPIGSKTAKSLSLLAKQKSRRNQARHCRKFNCKFIKIRGTHMGVEATFYLVRIIGQEKWKCIISTDQSLSFVKAMELYSARWTIEVFFKEAKQHLYLGKCQSNDFDAHIATNTISCMNYMALVVKKRFRDYETIGFIFRKWKNQMLKQTLICRIWKLLSKILSSVLAELGVDWVYFLNKIILDHDILNQLHIQFSKIFSFDHSLEVIDANCET